jgi:N-acetylglucosamine-6-phosphate deacetylase
MNLAQSVCLINASIFTGQTWMQNHVLHIHNGLVAYLQTGEAPEGVPIYDCRGMRLMPALVDAQVYGACNKLFAMFPQTDSLARLAAHNKAYGTATCMVTIATFPLETIYQCIDAVRSYWQQGGSGIAGLHVEGPFLHPERLGAHVAEWVLPPDDDTLRKLLDYGRGVISMMTIAPELFTDAQIKMCLNAGVVLSAGHSNATYEQAILLEKRGVKLLTHLFNAMPPLQHRKPGLAGAALDDASGLHASIIPDGLHVHPAMLRAAKACMGSRLFFITDAVAETTTGRYQHHWVGDRYAVADGTLSGSGLTMLQAVKNGISLMDLSLEESWRMGSLYPAAALGLGEGYGTVQTGAPARLVLIDEDLKPVASWW